MGLFGNFINFFNTKIKASFLKKELIFLRKKLRLFQTIFIDKEIHDSVTFLL